jgi:hypothetical protein
MADVTRNLTSNLPAIPFAQGQQVITTRTQALAVDSLAQAIQRMLERDSLVRVTIIGQADKETSSRLLSSETFHGRCSALPRPRCTGKPHRFVRSTGRGGHP